MNALRSTIDRRLFLKVAAPFLLGVRHVFAQGPLSERGRFGKEDVPLVRQRLLELVNAERRQHALSRLQLDELACKVADHHAIDMIEGQFLSHWGRDGRKPYQRYSFAGGTDATQENVSVAEDITGATAPAVERYLIEMHQSMLNEVPPDDGHRKTILFPHHTHVGFGIAVKEYVVRLDEVYVCRYVAVDPVPRAAKPASQINLTGRLLNPQYELSGIHVYYEPLPTPPPIEWLRIPRSYSLPNSFAEFLPRLPPGYHYEDGTAGSVEVRSDGTFRALLPMFKERGINTIVVWTARSSSDGPFPATDICIRCE